MQMGMHYDYRRSRWELERQFSRRRAKSILIIYDPRNATNDDEAVSLVGSTFW